MENEKIIETDDRPKSPYIGLVPFSERDAKFFFGRETETEIISANLRSARLTVLYGTSGVGKSSVLQAGVVHNLRQLAAEDVKTYGQAEFAVVTYRNWAGDPLKGIAHAVREAVAESLGVKADILEPIPETDDLVKILQSWTERYSLELLIILDQFESLFNYLTDKNSRCAVFADELAKAITSPDLCSSRFLISLRGDTLSLLDYFKESVPGLFDNRLQLYHLTETNAYNAITKPITAYNDLYKPSKAYEIESELVYEVIKQIKIGGDETAPETAAVIANVAQTPVIKDSAETHIETPYLQLVMKRIWREETQANSNILHLQTLTGKLGGTKQIIQTHLNETLDKLTSEEKYIASKCFKYLVTPMGTKMALTPAALAEYVKRDEAEIEAVLELLIKGKETAPKNLDINLPVSAQEAAIVNQPEQALILRNVEIPVGKNRLPGYEVMHDAYIPAILDWRERYVIEHGVWNQVVKYAKIAFPVLMFIGLILVGYSIWLGSWKNQYFKELTNANSNKIDLENEKNTLEVKLSNIQQDIEQNKSTANISSNEDLENKINKKDMSKSYKELISVLVSLSNNNSSAQERQTAIEKLKKLIADRKVPAEYEDSIIKLVERIDTQKANDLRLIANNANVNINTNNKSINRIYIQIAYANQRESAKFYAELLKNNNFTVSGIEIVDTYRRSETEIRYFQENDGQSANQIAEILRGNNVKNVKVLFISGYENSKHLEIWFSPDAFPNINQVAQ